MNTVIRFAVIILAVAVGCVGVTMTFRYGLVFTKGEDRIVFASLFAIFDGIKCLLPSLAAILLLNGLGKWVWKARTAYYFLVVLSGSAHVGLVMTLKAQDDDTATKAGKSVETADKKVKRLEGEIRTIEELKPAVRPLATIEEKIDTKLLDPKAEGCPAGGTWNGPVTKVVCPEVALLRAELKNRKDLIRLNAELDETNLKADHKGNQDGGKKVTVIAEALAEKTGLDHMTVMLLIALVLMVGIELCSSQILEMAVAAGHKPKGEVPAPSAEAIPEPLIDPNPSITIEDRVEMASEEAPEPPESRSELCPKGWVADRVPARRGVSTPWKTILATYRADAEAQGMVPASDNALTRALTAAGFKDRPRPKGVLMIRGAALREERTRLTIVSSA